MSGSGRWARRRWLIGLASGLAVGLLVCGDDGEIRELTVTASAYTSRAVETDDEPMIAAWGDRLEPGQRSIAVSRDLIEMGLDHRTVVEIEGLDGDYVVLDKMAARWRRHIDIYMGLDHESAKAWGRREVRIRWRQNDEGPAD